MIEFSSYVVSPLPPFLLKEPSIWSILLERLLVKLKLILIKPLYSLEKPRSLPV